MRAGAGLFAQCVAAVLKQAESELERRNVTPETADQWEQVLYAEDMMTDAGGVVYKVECRAKDGSDWFCVEAVASGNGTSVDIVLTRPVRGQE